MQNKKTYYQLILDRSGSMSDCINETISGFNEQVQMINDIQKRFSDQQFYVSLTVFNHTINHTIKMGPVNTVKPLSRETFVPDGTTALLDALGESVMGLKTQVENELRNDEATVVVVILTDGYENSSRIFNWQSIRRMILELEATKNWTFSFLGATFDALETAARLNIKQQNAAVFNKSEIKQTLESIGESFIDYAILKSHGEKPGVFSKK